MGCKVDSVVERHDLTVPDAEHDSVDDFLVARWTGRDGRSAEGYKSLTEWFNKRLLKRLYESHGRDTIGAHLDTEYDVITGESDIRRDELAADLATDGIDIDDLASDVETTEDRVTDLESEIKYTEAELADAREELEDAEAQATRSEVLSEEYDELTEEIRDLRTRKEEVKRRTRAAFSRALGELLERFETGFETARLTSTFELVVARDGRETPLDALSEGEREILGIVAALAGHETFDVDERVPILLLDGIGGLAGDNLELLVEYLDARSESLVLTAYPEHGGFAGHELSPAEWDVVSHRRDVEARS